MRYLLVVAALAAAGSAAAASPKTTSIVYDNFQATGGYTLSNYSAKWSNPFGPIEMAAFCPDGTTPASGETRDFSAGDLSISAVPFHCWADFSVFDHLKYLAVANASFPMPANGSLTFTADIAAQTPGTIAGRVVHGVYGPPGSYPTGFSGTPYTATLFEGQQAGATLHMISFDTGQLFDWFVSGTRAFTLIERLPSSVTGSPNFVGPEKMYTQIVNEVAIAPNISHRVSITYMRGTGLGDSTVEYWLDGKRISKVKNVGVPIDKQPGQKYTGYAPSLGPGEPLKDQLNSFSLAHGLFSLLDAFPYQWGWSFPGPTCDPGYPSVCALSVSIPQSERVFGQGAAAHFDNFVVTTKTN